VEEQEEEEGGLGGGGFVLFCFCRVAEELERVSWENLGLAW
jgi:hypothetical protein